MTIHAYVLFIAALIPLFVGFIWYHPKAFGNAWMKLIGATPESMKSGNMALIVGLCYLFALILAAGLMPIAIHQFAFGSVFDGDKSIESAAYMKNFYETYGTRFRTFKHGALHGSITALIIALPLIGTNALFERKGFKYMAIHVGYWIVVLALMGGVICQFA